VTEGRSKAFEVAQQYADRTGNAQNVYMLEPGPSYWVVAANKDPQLPPKTEGKLLGWAEPQPVGG
jgi:hypothetical protein